MTDIVHFHRKPFAGQHSIEALFATIRDEMQRQGCAVRILEVPHPSKGIRRRIINAWFAFNQRAGVNHVTGDIHYVALLLPGNRTVLTIHDCATLDRLSGLKRWLFKLFWFDLPIKRVNVVTVISEETKRQLLRQVPAAKEKIRVVPNCVSPRYLPDVRHFNDQCPQILHIGTKENKNLVRLLKALKGICCHLQIIGQLDDHYLEQARAVGISISSLTGLTDEQMYRCYCEADIVSFISLSEGFGLPILEANAVGRPVVTSNVSAMPEIAGDAACLVDPYDVEAIRSSFLRIIHDGQYREELVRNGFRNVERYQVQSVASQYIDIYERVARQRLSVCIPRAAAKTKLEEVVT